MRILLYPHQLTSKSNVKNIENATNLEFEDVLKNPYLYSENQFLLAITAGANPKLITCMPSTDDEDISKSAY